MADNDKTTVKAPSGTFGELKTMVSEYAKQQTVDPLKNLGQWAAFGVAGGVLLSIGSFLTALGVLRLLQKMSFLTNDEGIDTAWTFLPYMIVFALLLTVAVMCFWAMTRTPDWMDDDA